jgi:hypothetical protein
MAGSVAAATGPVRAGAMEYYCPRSNDTLLADGAAKKTGPLTFTSGEGATLSLTECSTRAFLCWHVQQRKASAEPLSFDMVVPRTLKGTAEYHLDGVRVLTWFANWDDRKQPAQVINWQKVGDQEIAIEFTLMPGQGMVFWDGLKFGSDEAEVCALESGKGLFSNVSFRYPSRRK